MSTLIEVFDRHLKDLKIDRRFVDHVYRYQISILNRNEEHLGFFGSNLLGVHVVRFRTVDELRFFTEILDVDYAVLENDIRKEVDTIVHEYKISGDIFNLTTMYLIYRCLTSPLLTEVQRKRSAYDMALIYFYRCLIIRQTDYFHFPADPKIAQAAYAELSQKFLIKKLGTWHKVMEYRAHDLINKALQDKSRDKDSQYYETLLSFQNDNDIVKVINDTEGRIRDLYKNYYAVFIKAHEDGTRIGSSSSTVVDLEGEIKLKEKTNSPEKYLLNIRQIVQDPVSFVKDDLVDIIVNINMNTSRRMVVATLNWMSVNAGRTTYHRQIDEFMSAVVVQSLHLLASQNPSKQRNYAQMLVTLKNLYLSTRSTDKDLIRVRELGDTLIKAANGKTNKSLAMATRTAIILYITLRAFISVT